MYDLNHHGDREVDGLADFAVNVFPGPRPEWLDAAIRSADLGSYPDSTKARAAIAALHGREVDEVLPTSGGAEAFTLIARARPWRHPVVVHPQFTEPEAALRVAGHPVDRVVLEPPFTLGEIPEDTDLVIIGNPTNPTWSCLDGSSWSTRRSWTRFLGSPSRSPAYDEKGCS
jgi:cobyrinic acid a,c-diamide synthase